MKTSVHDSTYELSMDVSVLTDPVMRISQTFNTLEYGRVEENINLAMDWIKSHSFGPVPKFESDNEKIFIMNAINNEKLASCFITSSIVNVEKHISSVNESITRHEQRVIMHKIVNSIKDYKNLFCELNLITKGVLTKHTENVDIPIMIDYLQYYAGKSYLQNKLEDSGSSDFVGIILNEDTQLCTFMMAVAPALVRDKIYICSGQQFIPIIQLCLEIFLKAGLPQNFVNVAIVNESLKEEFIKIPEFKTLIQIGNISEGKVMRNLTAGLDKTLSMLLTSKSTMIVFSDADINSVCNAVVNAAWTHSGKLPWSLSLLLIQEEVYTRFISNLKHFLSKLIFSDLKNKLTDVFFNTNMISQLKNFKARANMYDIETYDVSLNNDTFPLLAIGGKVDMNNVLTDGEELPIITILPFGKVTEAISVANNTKYGLAASVWSDNYSLSVKIAKQLQVSTVWINCHGQFKPTISLCPRKQSGVGYFGEEAGLLFNKLSNDHLFKSPFDPTKLSTGYTDWDVKKDNDSAAGRDVCNKVETSKKALQNLMSKSSSEKRNALIKLAEMISLNLGNDDPIINNWIHALYDWADQTHVIYNDFFSPFIYEPIGTIVIDCSWNKLSVELIVAALTNCNAVIIITKDKRFSEINKLVSTSGLPAGIMSVVTYNSAIVKVLASHQDIQAFYVELQSNAENENKLYFVEKESQYNLKNTFGFTDNCPELSPNTLQLITSNYKHILFY